MSVPFLAGEHVRAALAPDEAVEAVRTAFVEHGSLPWLHTISRVSGVSIQELYRLFPGGPSRLVAKIAGIPKLRACI